MTLSSSLYREVAGTLLGLTILIASICSLPEIPPPQPSNVLILDSRITHRDTLTIDTTSERCIFSVQPRSPMHNVVLHDTVAVDTVQGQGTAPDTLKVQTVEYVQRLDTVETFGNCTDTLHPNLEFALDNIFAVIPEFKTIPKAYIWLSCPTFLQHDNGLYGFHRAGTIALHPLLKGTVQERATMYHEWAHHYSDNNSRIRTFQNALSTLARESDAVREIRRRAQTDSGIDLNYWLGTEEIFARALAQYIALKSDDTEAWNLLRSKYPRQWRENDFERIERFFDVIFDK